MGKNFLEAPDFEVEEFRNVAEMVSRAHQLIDDGFDKAYEDSTAVYRDALMKKDKLRIMLTWKR